MVRILRGGARGAGRGAGRGGRGGAVGGGAGGGGRLADARLHLISKHRAETVDARDQLIKLAKKGGDARNKLNKIRNLKQGKLEVKKTASGAITITTTTKGNVLLTTKKKELAVAKKKQLNAATAAGNKVTPAPHRPRSGATAAGANVTRNVGRGGAVTYSTRKTGTALKPRPGSTSSSRRPPPPSPSAPPANTRRRAAPTLPASSTGPLRMSNKRLTRTIKGEMSEAAKLDEELLNTHVDPVILKRTVKQSIRDRTPPTRRYVPTRTLSPEPRYSRRERSRSPVAMDYDDRRSNDYARRRRSGGAGYNDYDDPYRTTSREDEMYRRRMIKQSSSPSYDHHRSLPTMANRLTASGNGATSGGGGGGSFVSPLQGAKIVVSNLQSSVSQEDIMELFGDIGPLKRAKIVEPGTAEVVFVKRPDALKAVEIYHNRQLDGKAMKCQVVGSGGSSSFAGPGVGFQLPAHLGQSTADRNRNTPHPEMGAIHKALFNEKRQGDRVGDRGDRSDRVGNYDDGEKTKPMFSVTVSPTVEEALAY